MHEHFLALHFSGGAIIYFDGLVAPQMATIMVLVIYTNNKNWRFCYCVPSVLQNSVLVHAIATAYFQQLQYSLNFFICLLVSKI